ncbi:MAG TPA: hypothetical protein VF009_06985 [Solirubrobacterales bacterium]
MSEDTDLVTKVVEAATEAIEGKGAAMVVNAETFAEALAQRGVPVKTLNRGALQGELAAVRGEVSVWKARRHNAPDEETRQRAEARVSLLQRREAEIEEALWPDRRLV